MLAAMPGSPQIGDEPEKKGRSVARSAFGFAADAARRPRRVRRDQFALAVRSSRTNEVASEESSVPVNLPRPTHLRK